MNLIINKKRPSSQIHYLQVGNKNVQQPVMISNAINTYFCNIPTELASKLSTTNRKQDLNLLQLARDSVNCLNHFCRPLSESGIYLLCINCYHTNWNNVEKQYLV